MRRWVPFLLTLILCGSAALRFVGLGRDIRRGSPTPDEWTNFVGPVMQMWEVPSADPHVHGGYPGFFNYLAFLPMGLGRALDGEAGACLAARALVASFGTANVLLLYVLLRPLWGAGPALLGAALLGASRSEVSEAHFISPDVVVVTAFLALALLARARPPGSVWPSVCAGLATAIKYSGVLLFPAAVAELFAARRPRRLMAGLLCGGLAFACAAPFALSWHGEQERGVRELVLYYFGPLVRGTLLRRGMTQLGEALSWIWINLGPVAVALVPAAAWARPRRALLTPVVVLVASLAALGLASQVYPRHVLLPSTAVTFLAAAGYAVLVERWRWRGRAAVAVAVLALALPLQRAVAVAAGYAQPTELEQAARWIESQPAAVSVATSLPRLRLDGRLELRSGLRAEEMQTAVLSYYDLVLVPRLLAHELRDVTVLAAFETAGNPAGALVVLRSQRPPEPPWPAPLEASGSAGAAAAAWDGDAQTAWRAPEGPGWIEARWSGPRALHAVEVTAPPGEGHWPQRLALLARRDGAWTPLAVLALRPTRTRLQRPPHGQIYVVVPPLATDALRIERRAGGPWGLSDVRVFSGPGIPD